MATGTMASIPVFTTSDYIKFFAAGATCCTLTHGAVTPLDVAKTQIQLNASFRHLSLLGAGRKIVQTQGAKALLTGFGATAAGYLLQGGAKFAGYEYWKRQGVLFAGGNEAAINHRTVIYLGSAAIAEFFADVLLAPLEATRIRMVSDSTYAKNLARGITRMAREGGVRELYAGFIPLLCKQIPYAIGQFATNEYMHEVVYRNMTNATKENLSTSEQTGITLGGGIIAGFSAAIVSNPADVLLSKINQQSNSGGESIVRRLYTLGIETGARGLFVGLGPRMVMTAALVSGQFMLYGIVKRSLGAEKGIEIHKD